MADGSSVREGQVVTGSLFNEPMRVKTVGAMGPDTWRLGMVGARSEKFRDVTLTSRELDSLDILDCSPSRSSTCSEKSCW